MWWRHLFAYIYMYYYSNWLPMQMPAWFLWWRVSSWLLLWWLVAMVIDYRCMDVDECLRHQPCHNNGICINTAGSYECKCHKGFVGRNCNFTKEDVCDVITNYPCQNSGKCVANSDQVRFFYLIDDDVIIFFR